jgi:hypothetical protein
MLKFMSKLNGWEGGRGPVQNNLGTPSLFYHILDIFDLETKVNLLIHDPTNSIIDAAKTNLTNTYSSVTISKLEVRCKIPNMEE